MDVSNLFTTSVFYVLGNFPTLLTHYVESLQTDCGRGRISGNGWGIACSNVFMKHGFKWRLNHTQFGRASVKTTMSIVSGDEGKQHWAAEKGTKYLQKPVVIPVLVW